MYVCFRGRKPKDTFSTAFLISGVQYHLLPAYVCIPSSRPHIYETHTEELKLAPCACLIGDPQNSTQVRTVYFFESPRTMEKVGKSQMQHKTPREIKEESLMQLLITSKNCGLFCPNPCSTAVCSVDEDHGSWSVSTWRISSAIPRFPFSIKLLCHSSGALVYKKY